MDLPGDEDVILKYTPFRGNSISFYATESDVKSGIDPHERMEMFILGNDYHLMPVYHAIREHFDVYYSGQDFLHYEEWWNYHSQYIGEDTRDEMLENPGLDGWSLKLDAKNLYNNPPLRPLRESLKEFKERKQREWNDKEKEERRAKMADTDLMRNNDIPKKGILKRLLDWALGD